MALNIQMLKKQEKKQCFYCGIKFKDLANVGGKDVCYICLRGSDKKK